MECEDLTAWPVDFSLILAYWLRDSERGMDTFRVPFSSVKTGTNVTSLGEGG